MKGTGNVDMEESKKESSHAYSVLVIVDCLG